MYKERNSSKKLAESVEYFSNPPTRASCQSVTSTEGLLKGWQHCSVFLLNALSEAIEEHEREGDRIEVATQKEALLATQAAQVRGGEEGLGMGRYYH